jgi:hypothetical protein
MVKIIKLKSGAGLKHMQKATDASKKEFPLPDCHPSLVEYEMSLSEILRNRKIFIKGYIAALKNIQK